MPSHCPDCNSYTEMPLRHAKKCKKKPVPEAPLPPPPEPLPLAEEKKSSLFEKVSKWLK